ncbi:MAG: hypothetical protein ABI822_26880 [Bryobacteraceae bacterium]
MERRSFLKAVPPALLLPWAGSANASFPPVTAVPEPHFPSRLHQFVWRNWDLTNLDQMAKVVQARPAELAELAKSMGLPPKRQLSSDFLRRIYITVIRQNWHLLPEEQIIELLGWDAERFAFTLKEDDFLEHKLGRVKPACDTLRYHKPDSLERKRAAAIRSSLMRWMPGGVKTLGQPRFAFVEEISTLESGPGWRVEVPQGKPALTAAAKRFGSGGRAGRRVELVLDNGVNLGPGDFSITSKSDGVRIVAATERAAIRGLYHLRAEPQLPDGETRSKEVWSPRFLYSYFALYGDPLMEGDAAGLPDGYLDRAAANGINGVWIQGVLNTLAPTRSFPEFGKGWETRLKNLRALVERAGQYGLRVYLYLNEPRAMPAEFFQNRPGLRGTRDQNVYAMCTSTAEVREWLRESLRHVFRQTPGLGGIFSITMSENHTNCFSHGGAWGDRDPVATGCPRCSQRTGADAIAELVHVFRDGIREQSATAEVMSYDWGWGTPLAQGLIPKLPQDTSIISISEWSQPVFRGGVKATVGEYSMSVVGPGPRAIQNWTLARERGLQAVAKTQFNNTWEISAVPYIPVLPLVLDHCENLWKAGITGVMASWTCGGYPSSNLRAALAYAFEPRPKRAQILHTEATRIYGKDGATEAVRAWEIFSEAFQSFPYGVSIYVLPLQHGPANPLRLRPTGLAPGMILFPYDAYKSWKGSYAASTVQELMAKLARRWSDGVAVLEKIDTRSSKEAILDLAIARTCHTHFESTANQVEFYLLRDEAPGAMPEREKEIRTRLLAIAERESELARLQYMVTRDQSLIGYEASNHYYYTPVDLLEKMLNCEQVIGELRAGAPIGAAKGNA